VAAPTVNSAWNNATAVLVGDFLISRAFQLIVSLKSQAIAEIMSDSTCIIAEGEVLQLINQKDPDTTEQRYMDRYLWQNSATFCGSHRNRRRVR
jgi:octaprenyl-diphosphate synthase